ncbi:hypothetical protein C8R44DRAFT_885520 [Mycena epipterygia]|nr:hypothetical protein C8R44DRAFT_885520 [Mycena epipterygia]
MPDIPLNAEWIPVFPQMNLMEMPPAGVLSVLQEFIRQFALPVYGCLVHMTAVTSPDMAILKKAIENFASYSSPPVLEIRLPRHNEHHVALVN